MTEGRAYQPYGDEGSNYLYSALFCDMPEQFADSQEVAPLFTQPFNEKAVRALAEDNNAESWIRAFAFGKLRQQRRPVPQRILLGVVVEAPLPRGLDTLAAYIDGRVRYVHGSGTHVIIEKDLPSTREPRGTLLHAAQDIVDELTPLLEPRSPPPAQPNVRVTAIASDGLYVGEANLEQLTSDPIGGPILRATSALIEAVVAHARANAQ